MALNCLIGRRNSESYITASQADTILTEVYGSSEISAWLALTTAAKNFRLKLAAIFMNALPYRGQKAYSSQFLSFPRAYPIQKDVTVIPDEAKYGQALIAFLIINSGVATSLPSANESSEAAFGRVNRMSFGGIFHIGLSDKPLMYGDVLSELTRGRNFIIYTYLQKYITSFRGGNVDALSYHTLSSTTTTSSSSSTSTTTFSTTTTT